LDDAFEQLIDRVAAFVLVDPGERDRGVENQWSEFDI
jgi:hypothetical protein